jgi:hypothetical protein
MKTIVFKIVSRRDGGFSVNQEANGYWWYHDIKLESYDAAEAWCNRHAGKDYKYVIDNDYIPRNMR